MLKRSEGLLIMLIRVLIMLIRVLIMLITLGRGTGNADNGTAPSMKAQRQSMLIAPSGMHALCVRPAPAPSAATSRPGNPPALRMQRATCITTCNMQHDMQRATQHATQHATCTAIRATSLALARVAGTAERGEARAGWADSAREGCTAQPLGGAIQPPSDSRGVRNKRDEATCNGIARCHARRAS
jgi:hypothetical protein